MIDQILSYGPMVSELPDTSDSALADWALEVAAQYALGIARYGHGSGDEHEAMLLAIGREVCRRNAPEPTVSLVKD